MENRLNLIKKRKVIGFIVKLSQFFQLVKIKARY